MDALVARMVAIGHPGLDTGLRTQAAVARVRRLLDRGDVAGAAEAMRSVVDFGSFVGLYTDRRYEALWPAMDRWTGGNLDRQQEASLRSYRADWKRGGLKAAARYAGHLPSPDGWPVVVDLFQPLAISQVDDDEGLSPFYRAALATPVADALIGLGRTDEAVGLLTRLAGRFDPHNPAPGLTARANLANAQLTLGRYDAAVTTVDRFLLDARALDGAGNKLGLSQTKVIRACALVGAGRELEAVQSIHALQSTAGGVPPSVEWMWWSCHGERERAKALLLRALEDTARRGWALTLLQPSSNDLPGEWAARQHAFVEDLRSDKQLVEAAEKVGRLLPSEPGATIPKGFDPKG